MANTKTKSETPASEEVVEAVAVEVPPPKGIRLKMLAVQACNPTAIKDANNPHFKSKYATLNAVWDSIRSAAAKAGVLVYSTISNGLLTTHAVDAESGEEMTSEFPIAGQTPQQIGSAITYARRYTISALFNVITDDDDDGNAASGIVFKQQLKPHTPPTAPNPPTVEDPIF